MSKKTPKGMVDCCYCLTTQPFPPPPTLVDCTKCGRPFRVVYDERGKDASKMELSKEAVKHYDPEYLA